MRVYIGTYTGPKSQGIYTAQFDPATGKLTSPELAAKATNPSFLALHPHRPFLYAVSETGNVAGKPGGAVSAFSIEKNSGRLTPLNQQPSGGADPCHLAVDKTGRCVLVANYGNGSVAAFALQPDGRLSAPSAVIQHQGSSVNPQRQAGPHAHFITPDPADRFALTCDLGLDKVLVYRLDPADGVLGPGTASSASIKPGQGPRHLAFHPKGQFVYVINEMGSTLTVFKYDPKRGALEELQNISTLPADFKGNSTCAEVQVHPSGKFVYGSNRGHDSIAVFATNPATGYVTLVEHQPTQGKTPRHFALDPGGKWLLAENQDSDSIVVFRVDLKTGRLHSTGQTAEVGAPVCLVFAAD
jgi:6-phosphogluconolactonase